MSYTVTKPYPQGTFNWTDVASTDFPKTKKFLTELFGWTSVDMPTGEGRPDYTMFYMDGHDVAGGSPSFAPQMPSFWANYIAVDNVDEMTTKAKELGATVSMEPMDVLDSGRMSVIQDPTGAHVSLWQSKKHIGAHLVNTVGAMSWNELYTTDKEKAEKFYGELLGWTFDSDKQIGSDYTVVFNNGRKNGGVMQITKEMMGMPPAWVVYFTVKDLDESLAKVKVLGGQVHMGPMDISIGKIGMIADPTGASMMLIEMSVKPDEWVE